jgi:hypothetical protein
VRPDDHPAGAAYGLVEGQWEWHLRAGGEPPEHAAKFVSVSSAFYPALSEHYAARAQEWITMSKKNPLPQQTVADLENAWRRASEEKRRIVFEFLRSHGYQRGWFRAYGARHLDFVRALLADRPEASQLDGKVPGDRFIPASKADPARFACEKSDCPLLRVSYEDTLRSFIHCLKCNRRVLPLSKN